jgi:hypothetical protein
LFTGVVVTRNKLKFIAGVVVTSDIFSPVSLSPATKSFSEFEKEKREKSSIFLQNQKLNAERKKEYSL